MNTHFLNFVYSQGGLWLQQSTNHQAVFHSFDKIVLLSEGHLLYFGKAISCVDYFSSLGFKSQIAMNPADFLLDLCSANMDDISMPQMLHQQTVKTQDIRQVQIYIYFKNCFS